MLLDHNSILSTFSKNVDESSSVDIATAWVTPGRHLEIIRNSVKNNGLKVRIIAGIAGNGTIPVALRSIMDFGELRIDESKERLFHPKFYLFHKKEKSILWVGSSNFTLGGFSRNNELIAEMEGGDEASQWFTKLWNGLPRDSLPIIERYTETFKNPYCNFTRNVKEEIITGDIPENPIVFLNPMPDSWNSYMNSLKKADNWWRAQGCHWNIFDNFRSYVHTISSASEVIHRESWNNLTLDDADILLSIRGEQHGAYGLLGHVGRIGLVKQAFRQETAESLAIREACRASLAKAAASDGEDFYKAVYDAITMITSFKRFGPAVATRFLTLACPGRAVSVNKASAEGLGRLFGLNGTVHTLGSADGYVSLLRKIHQTAWYQSPMPSNSFEQEIWGMRTALLDAFVYQPI